MSDFPIHVIGLGADGPASLRPEQVERIRGADFLAGGERHLAFFAAARAEPFVIKDNLATLVGLLDDRRRQQQRCVVLASGDPLFYGIGKMLVSVLGADQVRVEPALSSMQLAFARAGLSWQEAVLDTVHGRSLRPRVLPLLGRPLIGLFTHDGDTPAKVAHFFLNRGLADYEAFVGENLGAADERVTHWPELPQLEEQRFAHLNYLILRRTSSPARFAEVLRLRSLVPGVPDDAFRRPADAPEVMTRQEVRSVVVGKLCNAPWQPGDTVWDLGAGLGTVAVELAVLRPRVEIVAVEREAYRARLLAENRERFDAWNIRVVQGEVPEALASEADRPRAVFVGGSGGRLGDVLDFAAERLAAGGRLAAAFVTLEHWMTALRRVREWGWPWEMTELNVARSDALGGLTGLKPLRGVYLLTATRPGGAG